VSTQRLSKLQKCTLLLLYAQENHRLHNVTLRADLIKYLNKRELIRYWNGERSIVSPSFTPALSRSLANLREKGLIDEWRDVGYTDTSLLRRKKYDRVFLTGKGVEVSLKLTSQDVNFKEDFRNKKVKVWDSIIQRMVEGRKRVAKTKVR